MSLRSFKKNLNQYNLILYKPINPSLRHTCLLNKKSTWSGKRFFKLSVSTKYRSGRSKKGFLILFTRSNKKYTKIYRKINIFFINFGIPCFIHRIEYDPNRSSFISLNIYKNGLICYELQTNGLLVGKVLTSYNRTGSTKIKNGDSYFLKYIPEGSMIHSVEQSPFFGSQYSRSAGSFCMMIRKYYTSHKCLIQLKSGVFKLISMSCKGVIGCVSNSDMQYVQYGKAGRSRWLGIKPNVRGVAMNPVDHPHGGGEGKKSKKVSPRSSWGKIFKWVKTKRTNFKMNSY